MRKIASWMAVVSVVTGMASARADELSQVVVTVGMVADLVRTVGEGSVNVQELIGEGVDPHLYKPTRSDVASLIAADMIFCSGLHLEGKMVETLAKISRPDRPVVAVSESLPPEYLLHMEDGSGHPDPHVWMDPMAWNQALAVVTRTLIKRFPDREPEFTVRAAKLTDEMNALNAYAKEAIASIPESQRMLVTAHDAFRYFGRAFGLEVRGIQGISTESEAGLGDVNRIVSLLVDRKIPAVFVETSVADRNVNALLEGAGARGHHVRLGGRLFSDAMGAAGTYEGTYIGMIDHNVTLIARALGGNAPETGFQGKLKVHP